MLLCFLLLVWAVFGPGPLIFIIVLFVATFALLIKKGWKPENEKTYKPPKPRRRDRMFRPFWYWDKRNNYNDHTFGPSWYRKKKN